MPFTPPATHERDPFQRLRRAQKHSLANPFLAGNDVQAPVDAIAAVDVDVPACKEHGGVAPRRTFVGMTCGILFQIRLHLDNAGRAPVDAHDRPQQGGGGDQGALPKNLLDLAHGGIVGVTRPIMPFPAV